MKVEYDEQDIAQLILADVKSKLKLETNQFLKPEFEWKHIQRITLNGVPQIPTMSVTIGEK